MLALQDLHTRGLRWVADLEVIHTVISAHARAVTQPIHRKMLQDETKYLFVKLRRKQSPLPLPLPFHLSLVLTI